MNVKLFFYWNSINYGLIIKKRRACQVNQQLVTLITVVILSYIAFKCCGPANTVYTFSMNCTFRKKNFLIYFYYDT